MSLLPWLLSERLLPPARNASAPLEGGLPLVQEEPMPPSAQFYLGGAGTGAPQHYHFDALNVLVWGRKQWFVSPLRARTSARVRCACARASTLTSRPVSTRAAAAPAGRG